MIKRSPLKYNLNTQESFGAQEAIIQEGSALKKTIKAVLGSGSKENSTERSRLANLETPNFNKESEIFSKKRVSVPEVGNPRKSINDFLEARKKSPSN